MLEQIENSMAADHLWESLEKNVSEEVRENLRGPGYREMGTDNFVPESLAYQYALERCLRGTEEEKKEFREMLVEWFYSGNFIKEDQKVGTDQNNSLTLQGCL